MRAPTHDLSAHQREFFNHNGFLWLEAITTRDEVDQLRRIYDKLFEDRVGWDVGAQFDLGGDESDEQLKIPQLLNPSKFAPELKDTLFRRNAEDIAAHLLGADLDPADAGEHMMYKPPRTDAETPWHQDQAYHDPTLRYRSINFWMPLDDATLDSGCMQFVPRSRTRDVLPHRPIGGNVKVHGLEVDGADQFHGVAVACPVPAGGCTMHAAYMLHYTGPNRTENPRRAYVLVFKAKATPRDSPVDAHWLRTRHAPAADRRAPTQEAAPMGYAAVPVWVVRRSGRASST